MMLCFNSFGQKLGGYVIGYGVGSYRVGLHNLENAVYGFNHYHTGVTKQMSVSNIFQGITMGFSSDLTGNFGMEFIWSNKHMISTGQRDSSGTALDVSLKARLNTLNWGFFVKVGKSTRIGTSLDMGNFKVLEKKSSMGDSWFPFYDGGAWAFGESFFITFSTPISKALGLSFRPYYQAELFPAHETYTTSMIFSTDYTYRFSNFGLLLYLTWGSGGKE